MTARWRASVQVIATLVVAQAPNHAYAQDSRYLGLLPILPAYCRDTRWFDERVPGADNREERERWGRLMGVNNFPHVHHYCFGLADTHRALFIVRTKQDRDWYLEVSIKEFDYVLRLATPDFVLLPEVLTKRGENLLRLGRAPEAIPTFMRAIDIKPDYWPPYAALSDHYKEAGDTEKARAWLEKGLAASPGAKSLRERLNEVSRPPAK